MNAVFEKVLYVEDEPDIQHVARLATDVISNLIWLDVMMPAMDGPTALALLSKRSVFCATPAMFMAAKARAQDVEQLKRAGALDVSPKPFDPMTLSRTLLENWQRR